MPCMGWKLLRLQVPRMWFTWACTAMRHGKMTEQRMKPGKSRLKRLCGDQHAYGHACESISMVKMVF
jgi:hypothetical protein